ncbi:hypothetical protein OVA13_04345 [Pseudoxanthomonas sp. SL93]|uniref:hypothetical protein n=1 Tax=Pseudoxanthomonas sp. SL93 TaxID=2995142 RepID=UPI00226EE88B|nr:hypothetical protein [Pseudoxanthomonas sp. SL93]WAC64018.1 hypothetical protein OVA13_04345 [Pseudoxanthomonas sp. SL93]
MAVAIGLQSRGVSPIVGIKEPYRAIRLESTANGRPKLSRFQKVGAILDTPMVNDDSLLQRKSLIQRRVGAWVVERYKDHLECITAARMILACKKMREKEFGSTEGKTHTCCIGRGFAAWEQGLASRATSIINWDLWDSWRLENRQRLDFALYVLEKSCFSLSVLNFVENDRHSFRLWYRSGMDLRLTREYSWGRLEHAVLQANIDGIDTQDLCAMSSRTKEEKESWLVGLAHVVDHADTTIKTKSIHAASYLTSRFVREYDAKARTFHSAEFFHTDINRRVNPELHILG